MGKITEIMFVFCSITFVFDSSGPTAAAVDQTDGEEFVQRILNGEKISSRPEQLIFTAPYKLCDEGQDCNYNNFAMVFPLIIGKGASKHYKSIYSRDYEKLHSTKSNAPFKRKTTSHPFTLCSVQNKTCAPSTTGTTSTTSALSTTSATILSSTTSTISTDIMANITSITSTRNLLSRIITTSPMPSITSTPSTISTPSLSSRIITRSTMPSFVLSTPLKKPSKLFSHATYTIVNDVTEPATLKDIYTVEHHISVYCPNYYPYWCI